MWQQVVNREKMPTRASAARRESVDVPVSPMRASADSEFAVPVSQRTRLAGNSLPHVTHLHPGTLSAAQLTSNRLIPFKSVVKVFVVTAKPNCLLPWQMGRQESCTGECLREVETVNC